MKMSTPMPESITSSEKDKDIAVNGDGSVDVWFSPTAPKGHEDNWV